MKITSPKINGTIKSENLKSPSHLNEKNNLSSLSNTSDVTTISEAAKNLNTPAPPLNNVDGQLATAAISASQVAKSLAKLPLLPITSQSEDKDLKKLENKLSQKTLETNFIKKPAVIFIEGFSAFGISNGDGIKDMADNLPGAKRFSWDEQDKIIEEIKKHAPEQPIVLVGHSFGGDSAVEIANTLNSVKNGFRSIDLIVSIDSVGINHSIIPMNVKRNLNFLGEGIIPFLHGDPNVARNTGYSEVLNELRSELHSKMEDSPEVQFKIFESINEVINGNNQKDIFTNMQKHEQLKNIIGSQMPQNLKD